MAEADWDLVSQYFEATLPIDAPCHIGRLCEGIGLYHQRDIYCIDCLHYDPNDESLNVYKLCCGPSDMFARKQPVYELRLETREELVAIKAKRRPFVVISTAPMAQATYVSRLGDDAVLGVPLYRFKPGEEEFKARIAALEYNNLFYLPQESPHLDVESFCRFDRIQFLHPAHIVPGRARLTREAWWKFGQWLRFYMTGKTDDLMTEYRSIRLEALHKALGQT